MLGLALGPPVQYSFGSATLHVPLPMTILWAPTTGSANQPGSSGFAMQFSVPNSVVFSGLNLVSQAIVVDPSAGDGFAATNAVESWLH